MFGTLLINMLIFKSDDCIFRLNEGFASYMEYKGVANYHDDWEIEDQFISSDLHSVMKLDATVNSHPIVQVKLFA